MSATPLFDLAPADFATLRRLLDEALELPAAERSAWLDALPPEHAALRPRLEGLLAHADDSEETGTAARFTMPRLQPQGEPALPPDAGPYRAMRLIGEGGMGRVWLAERTDMLQGRPVALKLPQAAWRHPNLAERMAQEREILAVLDHPNIARIYDAGVTSDGQPYLALEYVEGQRIDDYAREHALDVRQRITLFLQVMSAVAHAHARLVVHRDLKPGNILVSSSGEVRLLDFGIAKLIAANDAVAAELTAPAQRALTPHYAAPEQILGQPIGTAADIYALGVVLYELLTGELPYKPKRGTAAALEETIVSDAPPRPSQRMADARQRRLLSGDLDTVLLKALKKNPAERYATVQAFADDLRAWLANRPVSARPDSAWYHARKFVQRNWLGVSVASGFVLSLGAALGVALWQANEARAQAAKAGAITDFLVGLFRANDIEQADGQAKRQQSVQQLLEHSADELAGAGLANQPEVRGELQRVVGGLLNDLEVTDAAIRVRQARVADLKARGAAPALQIAALRELGESQRENGDWVPARATLDEAHTLCSQARLESALACLGVELNLGRVDFAELKIDDGLKRIEPLPAALANRPEARGDLAAAYEQLALLRLLRNKPEESQSLFEQAVHLREQEWGAGSVRLAQLRYRFGRNLWAQRRLTPAMSEIQAAWNTTRAALGPEHVASARIELYLGRLQFLVGTGAEGLPHMRHARDALTARDANLDPAEAYEAQSFLANALLLDGHLAEARRALDDAIARHERLGNRAGTDPTLDVSQARWLSDTGHHAEARALLTRLRDATIAQMGADHPNVADRRWRLALAELAAGDTAAAQSELAAALATQDSSEQVFGSPKHRARMVEMLLRLEQGRREDAAALADTLNASARQMARGEIYRETVLLFDEAAARALAAAGRHDGAAPHFERFITTLAAANESHPWLAAMRAHYASSLLDQGRLPAARQQAAQARSALAAQPLAGPQFWLPLRAVEQRLGGAKT